MTIFFIITLVIMALGILLGLTRGTGKSVIRLISLILAAVVTFLVSIPIAKAIADIDISGSGREVGGVPVTTLSEYLVALMKSNETVAQIIGDDPTLEAVARQLPVMILAIATFILSFIVLYLISLLVYAIFRNPLMRLAGANKDERPGLGSRIGGATLGFLSAILCVGMILVPVLGTANMLKDLPEDSKISQKKEYYDPVVDSAIVKSLNGIGFGALGNMYMRSASKITTENGEVIYVSDDVGSIAKIYDLLVEYDIAGVAEDGSEGSTSFTDALADSAFTGKLMSLILESKILSKVLEKASYAGGEYLAALLGIPTDSEGGYKKMNGDVASDIDSNSESIESNGAYESYEKGEYTLVSGEESPVAGITADFAPTETIRFRIAGSDSVYVLTIDGDDTYIGVAADEYSTPEKTVSVKNVKTQIENLRSSLCDKIVKSVDTSSMSEATLAEFKKSVGVTVEHLLRSAFNKITAGEGKIDEKAVYDFFNTSDYADALLKEGSFVYGGMKVADFAAVFQKGISDLLNSEDEDAAETLASIIAPAAQIVNSVSAPDGGDSQYAYVAPAVGKLVSAIHDSTSLNSLGLVALEAMAESSAVKEIIPSTLTLEIISVYSDEKGDITRMAMAVASSANIVAALSSGDVDTVEKLIADLINNLNDGTAEQIKSLVTDEFMAKYINNAEYAGNAKTVSSAVLEVLSGAKGRASYRDEAESLMLLYDLAVNSHSLSTDDFKALLGYAEKSDIIADIIHRCTDCRVKLSASRTTEFANAMDESMDASTNKAAARPVYNDISTILGLGLTY